MSYSEVELFQSHSNKLGALTLAQKDGLCGLIWSNRLGVNSVAVITKERDILLSITGGIGSEIPTGHLYATDLESLGSDKIRVYVDPREQHDEEIILLGYYLDQAGVIYEYKEYRKIDTGIFIDRFDVSGTLIAKDEPEYPTTEVEWRGPSQVLAAAKESGLYFNFFKKGAKDQSYLNIRFDIPPDAIDNVTGG